MTPAAPVFSRESLRHLVPGLVTCAVIGAAATFLSEHYGAPVMLFALLLGMAMNFMAAAGACQPGITFASTTLLRLGIALLGLRVTAGQIASLGWLPVIVVVVSVITTIAVSMRVAKWLGFQTLFGLLSGGATAICGASAALALAAALPAHPLKERATLFTVVGVSALSTLAMIVFPLLAHLLGLHGRLAGLFLGATIHDVAQVVGAGYSMSREAGDVATFVKLLRVAMLLPVTVFAVVLTRDHAAYAGAKRPPLLPWFIVAFAVLVAINSALALPPVVTRVAAETSRWCLVVAMAAIGTKSRIQELSAVGIKPVLLMIGETVFLVGMVLSLLHWLPQISSRFGV